MAQIKAVVIPFALLALMLAVAGMGRFLAAPAAQPVAADLVVVLGGDGGMGRTERAGRLVLAGYASRILLTGAQPGGDEADPRVRLLAQMGVQPSLLLFDTRSRNSWEEAAATSRLMGGRGWRRALVVSDPPHLRRLKLAWGRALAGSGREYVLVATEAEWWHPNAWWQNPRAVKFVCHEAGGLALYALRAVLPVD